MVCIYDSGVGGLTALRALRAAAPLLDVIYLGDTARLPYGTKDADTVYGYAKAALDYLVGYSPEAVLVACGTVSSVALPRLLGRYSVPILGIADAGIAAALAAAPCGRIAVLGTEATVRSRYFERKILAQQPSATVRSLACPLFVALAEEGAVAPDDPLPRLAVERATAPLCGYSPEAVILGCTHFPWLSPHLERALPGTHLIDCGAAAVDTLLPTVARMGSGVTRLLVTEGRDAFLRTAHRMAGGFPGETVETVAL